MLDIFYKEVIYEAITGTIESDGIYNILFITSDFIIRCIIIENQYF